jgi:tetratricopeptide (TPR) repeat protein
MAIESQRKITSRFHPSLIPLYHQLELCYWAYGLGLEDLPMIDLLESEENHSTGNSRANIQLYLAYHLGLKSRRLERKDFAEKSAEYARKAGKTVQLQRMTSLDDATFYGNLGIVYYNLLDMEKAISNLQLALTTFRFELGRSHPAIQKYQTILDIAAEMKVHKEKNYKLKIKKRLAIVSDLSDGFGFEAFKVIARKKKNSEKTVQGVQWSGQRVQWTATTKSLSKYNPDNPHNPHFHSSNKTTSRYRLV